ncbi:MAG: glycosyltransferase family 2 protein [Nitrososphaeria archaeon]|nr:glycosyltransferase family 2 protein [Nitrososphaeria archaeon]
MFNNISNVSIIILNWNNSIDTIECLESLYAITYPSYDVIVVDNGSKDESVLELKEYCEGKVNGSIMIFELSEADAKAGKFNYPIYKIYDINRRLILIRNRKNLGYSGGNNIGIKFALSILDPDYILLLNNDTVVDKYFLNELVKVAESSEEIGIAGPKIYYYNYNNRSDIIQFAGAELNTLTLTKKVYGYKQKEKIGEDQPVYTHEVNGACMLIKKNVFSRLGLLDEKYFAYWEETDFCFKALENNFKLIIVPTSKIWHKAGSNNPKEKRISALATYLFGRNAIHFIRNNLKGFRKIFSLIFLLTIKFVYLECVYIFYYKNGLGLLKGINNEIGRPSFLRC